MFKRNTLSIPNLVFAVGTALTTVVGVLLYHLRAARKLELQAEGKIPPDPAPVLAPREPRHPSSRHTGPTPDDEVDITGS